MSGAGRISEGLALEGGFGTANLRPFGRVLPDPGPHEVVVRIRAAALNYRDLQVIDGLRKLALPLTPLSDAAGVVEEVGAAVTRVRAGDRVMPCFAPGWLSGPLPPGDVLPTLGGPLDGTARSRAVWHEDGLVRIPDGLDDMEAATLPCAAVSAWNALFEAASVRPGETVLVEGTGGVSLFALQFAKRAGARVVVVSGSDEKIERARRLGADAAVNYRTTPRWGEAVRKLAGGDGVDLVVEIGGTATMPEALAALRNGGAVSYVGFVTGTAAGFDLGELSRKSIRLAGIRVGNRDSFERMCRAVALGGIRPVVDSEFPLDRLGSALERLRAGLHFGKIGIRIP